MIRGVIFDLDGTLLNTLGDITDCVNMTAEIYGIEAADEKTVMMRVGNGSRVLIKRSLSGIDDDKVIDEALNKYKELYQLHFMDKTRPYDGIEKLITELSQYGLKIGVNTNKFDGMAKDLVKKHFPEIDVSLVSGQRTGIKDKPAPDAAEMIIQLMGLKKKEVIFVGDSGTDIMTGKNTGLFTVGVTWGYRDRSVLEDNGADLIVDDPAEIVRYIKGE